MNHISRGYHKQSYNTEQHIHIKELRCTHRQQLFTMIWPNGPIFMIFWNCSYMSRNVNWPVTCIQIRQYQVQYQVIL